MGRLRARREERRTKRNLLFALERRLGVGKTKCVVVSLPLRRSLRSDP